MPHPRLLIPLVAAFALLFLPRPVSAQIFADVTVAGAVNGTFTIDLEHTKVPTTVANFVGLATGQRPWIDFATGAVRTGPFYAGVTFHRVIAGFMNQTGSRKGDGSDGPGYSFKDEFDPTLRHDAAYVVSMANSGAHSNGSQIFITAAPQPGLNDKHSVFGRVVSGQSIIDAINTTPVNGSVPQTPITIQAVAVHGPSLASFDLFPATLPTIVDAQPVLTKSGATFTLNYDARTYSNYIGYRGDNLSTWTAFANSYFGGTPPTSSVNVTSFATGARYFFRLARIDYSTTAARFIPASAAGRTFTFTSNFPALIIVTFNSTGTGGTWNIPGSGTGIFSTLFFSPGRFNAAMRLLFDSAAVLGGNVDFRATVDYTSANAGPFTGSTNLPGYPTLTGTFTTTP